MGSLSWRTTLGAYTLFLMRQAVIVRHGGPEALEIRESPDPAPGRGEVRIRVRAAGINFADVLARLGWYPDAPKPPMVVGYEVAGTVDAVGEGVAGFARGERVTALTRFGGYSDTVICASAQAFHTPSRLSDTEAAAIPVKQIQVRPNGNLFRHTTSFLLPAGIVCELCGRRESGTIV